MFPHIISDTADS